MFKLGKNLWYSDGEKRSEEAFDLIKKACELLNRYELVTACNNLIDNLIVNCDCSIERHTDFLPYLHNADKILSYQKQIDLSQTLKGYLENLRNGVDIVRD
jgi:hypothetical protein